MSSSLQVLVDNEWGTVCNRSWTAFHAQMVCNRLGLVMDPQYFEVRTGRARIF